MCIAPKKIQIEEYTVYVPCGKCLECQNQSRSEWVLRCMYELKVHPYSFFVTLTYDDEYLPAPYMDSIERKNTFMDIFSGRTKNYGSFLLDKDHAKNFLRKFKIEFLKTFYPIDLQNFEGVQKQLALARQCKNTELYCRCRAWLKSHPLPYPRYMLTGEYGTLNKRPHLHILFFFDKKITDLDLLSVCKTCWSYGIVDVEPPKTDTAVFNYVSKHQIKEDCGTKFQMSVSPIFKLSSTYLGGIGSNLRDDKHIHWKYDNRDNGVPQLIELPYNDSVNTFPFPRYLRKFLHPDNLSANELNQLESDSKKHVFSMLPEIPLECDNFDEYIKFVFSQNRKKDFQERLKYFDNKFKNKLLKHKNNGTKVS